MNHHFKISQDFRTPIFPKGTFEAESGQDFKVEIGRRSRIERGVIRTAEEAVLGNFSTCSTVNSFAVATGNGVLGDVVAKWAFQVVCLSSRFRVQ